MAHEAHDLRREERPQQLAERHRARRQQRLQHGGGEAPVEDRQHELPRRETGRGRGHLEAAEAQGCPAHEGQDRVGEAEAEQGEANGADERGRRQVAQPGMGSQAERRAAEHEQAQPEGRRLEEHDPRQLEGAHAPARVEAEAHRRAGEHSEAEAVADRVADEPGQGDAAAVEAQARVGDGQLVVAGQDEVVEGGEQESERHPARGQPRDRRGQLGVVDLAQLAVQNSESGEKEGRPREGGEPPQGAGLFWDSIHAIASFRRRWNPGRLSLKRWSAASMTQSRLGSRACARMPWISGRATNSSWVE